MTARILVSACLLGEPVRYNGTHRLLVHAALDRWRAEGRLVPVCPELAAGLPVPRLPSEIAGAMDGTDVLDGRARIVESDGRDVTSVLIAGAEAILATAREAGASLALMTDASPSCGSTQIHDGRFLGRRHPGSGVAAALLRRNGVAVFSQEEIEDLVAAADA